MRPDSCRSKNASLQPKLLVVKCPGSVFMTQRSVAVPDSCQDLGCKIPSRALKVADAA